MAMAIVWRLPLSSARPEFEDAHKYSQGWGAGKIAYKVLR
jgi:hypothetical protein